MGLPGIVSSGIENYSNTGDGLGGGLFIFPAYWLSKASYGALRSIPQLHGWALGVVQKTARS